MIDWRFGLALALGSLTVDTAQADPNDARVAWAALLRSTQVVVPAGSGCEGDYGQKGPARLGDVLAMQLAYMPGGVTSTLVRPMLPSRQRHWQPCPRPCPRAPGGAASRARWPGW